jgi:hypothetical protein
MRITLNQMWELRVLKGAGPVRYCGVQVTFVRP